MELQNNGIPKAYFITFSCYGTWLHGEKATAVDLQHNVPRTKFLSPNVSRSEIAKKHMKEKPYFLGQMQRQIVLNVVEEVCRHYEWSLLAAHVRTNHVHLVIHACVSPERIMNSIKAYATRRLNESKLDGDRMTRWARHGSTRYLWSEAEVEATIKYVVHEQGFPMEVYENKTRTVL